ncbi:MAG: hypothetical protein NW241_07100 [Bacteroidia bacterium]|nr:hypothetical protein [Bacteroidia bacterium]
MMLRPMAWALLALLPLGPLTAQSDSTRKAERTAAREARQSAREAYRMQKTRYLVLETAPLHYGVAQDQRMMQSTYRGLGTMVRMGHYSITPKGVHDVDWLLTRFSVMFGPELDALMINSFNEFSYTYLRNVRMLGAWQLRLGGTGSLLGNLRVAPALANSSINLDVIASAAAAGSLERYFTLLKRETSFSYQLQVPVFSYVGRRPAYGLSGFGGLASYAAPIGRFTRVVSEAGLTRPLGRSEDNAWRVAYSWDFYAFRELRIHHLRVANHALSLALLIRF